MDALTFLKKTTELGASDLFIVAGLPLSYKKSGQLIELTSERIMPENTEILIREIYSLAGDRDISHFLKTGDDDFSFAVSGLSRFRVNTRVLHISWMNTKKGTSAGLRILLVLAR